MKLLVVVDKLLTGFNAPPCTYLYIDKSMQDHGLFQAICRTNRLDGEDQGFRLHRRLQGPIQEGRKGHRRLHLGTGGRRQWRSRPADPAEGSTHEGPGTAGTGLRANRIAL